jgi:hypothetical protein
VKMKSQYGEVVTMERQNEPGSLVMLWNSRRTTSHPAAWLSQLLSCLGQHPKRMTQELVSLSLSFSLSLSLSLPLLVVLEFQLRA